MSDEPVAVAAWRCFHCGETFTDEHCARLHFGRDDRSEAACVIKAGAEGSLLKALRDAEEQADDAIQRMHDESTDAAKAYHRQRCRHAQSLIAAEEAGYERGLKDAGFYDRSVGAGNPHELAAAALVALAEHGVGPDIGEMLVQGNLTRGVRPGAIYKLIEVVRAAFSPTDPVGLREAAQALLDDIAEHPGVGRRLSGRKIMALCDALNAPSPLAECPACAEFEKLRALVQNTPIKLEMRDVYEGQVGYRTPQQISDAAWYTGQPNPGASVPALEQGAGRE